MKNKIKIFIVYLSFAMLTTACDQRNAVLAVKNQTTREIVGVGLVDDSLVDGDLLKDELPMNIYIDPGKFQDVGVINFRFNEKKDTSKLYLYIFDKDTLSKYRELNMHIGILSKSLIKKLVIQLNTVKGFDTLYVKQDSHFGMYSTGNSKDSSSYTAFAQNGHETAAWAIDKTTWDSGVCGPDVAYYKWIARIKSLFRIRKYNSTVTL